VRRLRLRRALLSLILCFSGLAVSCAPRASVMPPAPVAPRHPDFQYPAVPESADPNQANFIERGWRYLQSDNLRNAEREFQAALKTEPSFHPAEAALGYLELARRDSKDAIVRFDRALQRANDYAPALVGRGQALLELGRDGEALASFEQALKAAPALTNLQGRIDVLRFRALQNSLARAKAASDAGRWDEARSAYAQALEASPESAFLYRDLALVELSAGQQALALEHFQKAVSLDPSDARSHAQIGALLEEQGDVAGALAALEKARALDATEVPPERITRLRDAAALAKLPAEYRAIPSAPTVTRGDVAALIGVRLAPLLSKTRLRQAVVTDVRGHWAQEWILPVVRAGVMDTQPNYTFQARASVRRGELAQTVSRVLNLIAARTPAAAKAWQAARQKIPDVPPGHLNFAAVSQAVASGVMPLNGNGTFELLRPVSGAELVDVVKRLEALASSSW
jgi:tetratricopeptide (TPR) repeat protein